MDDGNGNHLLAKLLYSHDSSNKDIQSNPAGDEVSLVDCGYPTIFITVDCQNLPLVQRRHSS